MATFIPIVRRTAIRLLRNSKPRPITSHNFLFTFTMQRRNYSNQKPTSSTLKNLIATDILMRSVAQDSRKHLPSLTFGDLFKFTKGVHHDKDYSLTTFNPQQFLIQSAEFTRNQYSVRIAKLIMWLKNLPYGVAETEAITSVIAEYIESYQTMKEIKTLTTMEEVDKFSKFARYCLLKHLLVIPKISYGLLQKATEPNSTFSVEKCPYLNDFIDEFATGRISIRVLAGNFIAIYDQIMDHLENGKDDKHFRVTGLFEENCDVVKHVNKAIIDTQSDVYRSFDNVNLPRVNIYDKRTKYPADSDKNFTYIPEHLHHMVFELLKNSMRAVVEFYESEKCPDIDIIIVNDDVNGSVSIKISDVGGGISRDDIEKIWLYSYTTAYDLNNLSQIDKLNKQKELLGQIIHRAEEQWKYNDNDADDDIKEKDYSFASNVTRDVMGAVKAAPMFGLGYGVPIVNVYAKYFGGNVKIQSIDQYGTDAYLYLNNLKNSDVDVL